MTHIEREWGKNWTLSPEGIVTSSYGDVQEGIRVSVIPQNINGEDVTLYQAFRVAEGENGASIEKFGPIAKSEAEVLATIDRITHEEWEAEFERKHDAWGDYIYDPTGKATVADFMKRCKEKAGSFTAKDYDELEDINYHGVNALILAYKFADSELYFFAKKADGSQKLLSRAEFIRYAEINFRDWLTGNPNTSRRRFNKGIHASVYHQSHEFYYKLPDAVQETTEVEVIGN